MQSMLFDVKLIAMLAVYIGSSFVGLPAGERIQARCLVLLQFDFL